MALPGHPEVVAAWEELIRWDGRVTVERLRTREWSVCIEACNVGDYACHLTADDSYETTVITMLTALDINTFLSFQAKEL